MKNMKKTKTIMLSALAAVAFGSIAAGTTYALFTSEAEANVTVVAGKVSVKAAIQNLKLYSLDEESGEIAALDSQDTFTNGGTVAVDGANVALSNITPGDKVEFELKVSNESTVAIKYRTVVESLADAGLFSGLNIKIDSSEFDGGRAASEYRKLEVGSDPIVIPVSIELPSDAGNGYQEKSCSISCRVEAVQGNAFIETIDEDTYPVYTTSDLVNFAEQVDNHTFKNAAGEVYKKVWLMSDIDMSGVNYQSPYFDHANGELDFDGKGHTISNFAPKATHVDSTEAYIGLFGKTAQNVTIHDLNFKNATIADEEEWVDGTSADFYGAGVLVGIAYAADTNEGADNPYTVKVENVSIDTVTVKNAKYGGAFVGYCSSVYNADSETLEVVSLKDITLNNASIATYTCGGLVGQLGSKSLRINGVKGSNNIVDGYKREGGMLGAHSGSGTVYIDYVEGEYSSSVSGEAISATGAIAGLATKVIVNGTQII